jgi:hypothetical protein
VNNGESEEELFGLRLFKSLLSTVPSGTLHVKTVNQDTFRLRIELLSFNSAVISLNNLLHDISGVLDLI